MIEENVGSVPIRTGEKTMVEILITDEDKAFDFFGKALTNRLDTSKYGFEVLSLSFSKDKYLKHVNSDLRKDISSILEKTILDINDLIISKGDDKNEANKTGEIY